VCRHLIVSTCVCAREFGDCCVRKDKERYGLLCAACKERYALQVHTRILSVSLSQRYALQVLPSFLPSRLLSPHPLSHTYTHWHTNTDAQARSLTQRHRHLYNKAPLKLISKRRHVIDTFALCLIFAYTLFLSHTHRHLTHNT